MAPETNPHGLNSSQADPARSTPDPGTRDRRDAACGVLLWLALLAYGALCAPVPGVNEPHYLGKAKHFWDPAWCAGDLLMESSNAHAVFYFTFGAWAGWLTLPQLAWLGRCTGYALMAWGWLRAHRALGLAAWQPCWSLLAFLALASWGNFSGEWIVGGIEGKVVAYGFLLLAFAEQQSHRPYRAALCAGLAVSFHPVAGGWGVLAALAASAWGLRDRKPSWGVILKSLGVMTIAALPGMIPALGLILTDDPRSVRIDGTFLQVYYRLAHHLDPMTFSRQSWIGYGLLLAIIVLGRQQIAATESGRVWLRIVLWAGGFALIGVLAGWGPRPAKLMPFYLARMSLLKFYPFRLFDVIVPLTVAIQGARLLGGASSPGSVSSRRAVQLAAAALLLATLTAGEWRRDQLRKPTVFDTPEWLDVCRWVQANTAATALFQTPVHNQNFKWYAGRAEYVTYKDVPQDNRSLVEWNQRLLFLNRWYRTHYDDALYSIDELRSLNAETGITHIVTDRLGPFELAPRYTNARFRVYDLTKLAESPSPELLETPP